MYDDHYGLRGRPFQLTPDPRFWFESATHRKAMAYLGYGLSQGEGFIVVTGDIGAGKTTLVGHLMASIDREQLHVIKLVSTQIDADDLLRLVAHGLDVDCAGLVKAQLLDRIERQLHAVARTGRRTLLIVDEAQALAISALEELRMLSNFQAGGHALLQIFMLGQPDFRERLNGSSRLEQLRQRIIAIHHLEPMGRREIEPYVLHRLQVVGWEGRPNFTADAFDALFDGSDGVPRRLNQLAGRVMLFGAVEGCEVIDANVVNTVIADIAGDHAAVRDVGGVDIGDGADEVAKSPAPDQFTGFTGVAAPEETTPLVQSIPADVPVPHNWRPSDDATTAPVDDGVCLAAPIILHAGADAPPLGAPLNIAPSAPDAPIVAIVAEVAGNPSCSPAIPERAGEDSERSEHALATDPLVAPSPIAGTSPDARIAALEARVEDQEAALRRVLTLLVDWVESDGQRPDLSTFTGSAA
ncbi:MAG: AAA family ATPase [Sphingomonas sp.]